MQRGQWITLDSVINDYIDESEQSIHKYYKLFNLGVRGMDDLGLDFFYQIQTLRLPINANGTVTMPPCANWTKIGLFGWNGEIIPLGYNERLTSFDFANPNRKSQNTNSILTGVDTFYSITSPSFFNYWDGAGWGCLNGGAGWCGGTFNVDMQKGVIILDNWASYSDIAFECMVTPTEGEEYYIPLVFREALIAWLAFMDVRSLPRSRRGDLGEKRDRRHEYYNARRLAQSRWKPFNIEQSFLV